MPHSIIDNAFDPELIKELKNLFLSHDFPWRLADKVSNEDQVPASICSSYYFTHHFSELLKVDYSNLWMKERERDCHPFELLNPILKELEPKAIIRIKGNLYPSTSTIEHHNNHQDYQYHHNAAILYLNTNDGLTILNDSIEVKSVENRLLLFDGSLWHRSTTCTDAMCRININFNYF